MRSATGVHRLLCTFFQLVYIVCVIVCYEAGWLPPILQIMIAKRGLYSVIEGYKVAGYKEQPHTYMEE